MLCIVNTWSLSSQPLINTSLLAPQLATHLLQNSSQPCEVAYFQVHLRTESRPKAIPMGENGHKRSVLVRQGGLEPIDRRGNLVCL